MQLESADAKQNAISKSLFQDSFRHIFWGNEKNVSYSLEKVTFNILVSLILMYGEWGEIITGYRFLIVQVNENPGQGLE